MRRDDRWVGGAVLIAIGAALLVGQLSNDAGRYVLLGLGLVLLVIWAVSRNPGALIGGGIVTGLGAGVAVASYLSDLPDVSSELAGAAVLFGLGGGFLFIWLIGQLFGIQETRFWPLIPGSILVVVGIVLLMGTEAAKASQWIWPLVIIGLGVVVLAGAIRGRTGPEGPTGTPPTA